MLLDAWAGKGRIWGKFAPDSDGVITLTVPYTVTEYTGDDAQLYTGGRTGSIAFELNIR